MVAVDLFIEMDKPIPNNKVLDVINQPINYFCQESFAAGYYAAQIRIVIWLIMRVTSQSNLWY